MPTIQSNPAQNWTKQQLAGIQTVGRSLLVSAAAGSGKTAVLAERCAHLVCDAENPCGIDQLLVVTFTESAAAAMKTRIQQALRQRMNRGPSERIARQLAVAEHAHVGTLHGFCARLLRQNFNLAGIDPEFKILDADEAALLRLEKATELFHERYETDETGDFHRFVDAYGDGNDESLIQQVIAAHGLLCSLIDPQKWIEQTAGAMDECTKKPLESTRLGQQLLGEIDLALGAQARRCQEARKSILAFGGSFSGYIVQIDELAAIFAHWQRVLRDDGLDMLVSEVSDYRAAKPRAPAIRGQVPGKEIAKTLLDSVKNAVDSAPLADLLACTAAQWQQGMADVAPHAKTFLWLVGEFGRQYDDAKHAIRALDFADLERMTLNMLSDGDGPSPLARSLHEQFRHVLVDEYQDINPIQDAILTRVSRECLGPSDGNLFCVGDVKQSIFRFRLAEPGRFLDRLSRFSPLSPSACTQGEGRGEGGLELGAPFRTRSDPHPNPRPEYKVRGQEGATGQVIHLRENFRSRAPLLEAINGIFRRLMTREAAQIEYNASHHLQPGRTFPPAGQQLCFGGAPIELHLLPKISTGDEPSADAEELDRTEYEAILLAKRIRQLMGHDGSPRMHVCKTDAAGNTVAVPIGYGDIVILLRAMQHKADQFADVLRGHGIPVHSEGGGGFFQAAEVRDILCLLQILDNQQQDIPLAAVLRGPLAGLPNPDDAMAQIRLAYPGDVPFHQAVQRYARERDDELAAHLGDFLDQLRGWRDQANRRPVAELLWQLYDDTGYLAYCSGLEDGQQRVANLVHLHERAGQFGSFLRQGLYRFLRFLESLAEQKDIGRPSPAGQADQVVRIMSIHRSKGLEFPVVLLPDLGKAHNLADTKGAILLDRAAGLGMAVVDEARLIRYSSLASTLVRQSLLRQTLAEELRLLYVAATRAKEHLILVGTCQEEEAETWMRQWSGQTGPLPADAVLGGMRVLDWLGPVAAMTAGDKSPIFQIHRHAATDVRTWKNPRHQRPEFSRRQQSLARLEKLPADPPVSAAAAEVIQRFQRVYAHAALSNRAATASVTSLAKDSAAAPSDGASAPLERKLDLPRFFMEDAPPKPTDIGNATHAVLQHFDFGSANSIDRQIESLVDRKLLSPAHARLVKRDAIRWFLDSDVGALLKANHASLMREVPFALASLPPGSEPAADPLDQIMIRGRIDLLVPASGGMAIVDYKTDNVAGPAVAPRVESYARQMRLYSQAIADVARRKITAIYLVFLTPRLIVQVDPPDP